MNRLVGDIEGMKSKICPEKLQVESHDVTGRYRATNTKTSISNDFISSIVCLSVAELHSLILKGIRDLTTWRVHVKRAGAVWSAKPSNVIC